MVEMTKIQIENFLTSIMPKMEMPEAFLGCECNTYGEWGKGLFYKEWDSAELKFLIANPWGYRDFVGNQGGPLLYKLINEYRRSDGIRPFKAERSFMPISFKELRYFEGIPMFGLESKKPMGEFDVVGFSLGFPPFLANVVKVLKLSGIPVRWKDREEMKENYPLIISGGSTFGSPEIWSPIVDFMFIGEAEDEKGSPGLMAVLEDINSFKKEAESFYYTKEGREELLHFLAKEYDFLYMPKFLYPKYKKVNNELKIECFEAKYDDIPKKIKKRFVKDLNNVPCVDAPPVPWIFPEMGLGEVELARGCNAGNCSFCAVGYRYRPYRERSIPYMVKALKANIKNSGSIYAFPTAFEYTGYTQKNLLTKTILEEVSDTFDSQSQRIDSMAEDANFSLISGEGGMNQLAVGVEGSSERLRTFVNKGATEEVILKACENVIKGGYKKLKLYMIANLPFESDKDIEDFLELCKKIMDLKTSMGSSIGVRVSFTPLLIESWTPFQWHRATVGEKRLTGIFQKIRDLGIEFTLGKKTKENYLWSTQVAHLCDRLGGYALVDSYDELDAAYIGAVDSRMKETLEKNLQKYGVSYEYYFKEKPWDYIFGWDHIDIGVTKDYIYELYKKSCDFMLNTELGEDHRGPNKNGFLVKKCLHGCSTCGACSPVEAKKVQDSYKAREKDISLKDLSSLKRKDESTIREKVRLKVCIHEKYKYVENVYWKCLIRRAAWKADIPITKRSIRFVSDNIKFKNWLYGIDYIEFGLLEKYIKNETDLRILISEMNKELTHFGIEILDGIKVPFSMESLKKQKGYSLYQIDTDKTEMSVINALNYWHKAEKVTMKIREMIYRAGLNVIECNAKDFVSDIWAVREGLEVKLKLFVKGKASPFEVYNALFNKVFGEAYKHNILRVDSFVSFKDIQADFFRPSCVECGKTIPVNFLDKPLSIDFCPRCADKGKLIK